MPATANVNEQVRTALDWLKRNGTKAGLESLARYGVRPKKAFGVSVSNIQVLAKRLGRNHDLATALWKTGWYEARMLASYVDDPKRVTSQQLDSWCRDFDNWGICDTACFVLFDRTPHAWDKVKLWYRSRQEFIKRAAFALLWGLTVHDKISGNDPFIGGLELIERGATDERHFVKKSVNMALRAIGKRNAELNAAALSVAKRLATSDNAFAQWIGKDAVRELQSASVVRRLKKA